MEHDPLSPAQEAVVLALSRNLLLPLDDLLTVCRAFIDPEITHKDLAGCLNRRQVGGLRDIPVIGESPADAQKRFRDFDPGYLHLNMESLPEGFGGKPGLFIAADRATRWAFTAAYAEENVEAAVDFLQRLTDAAPFKVTRVLTPDRPPFTGDAAELFTAACGRLDIRHHRPATDMPQGEPLADMRFTPEDFAKGSHHRPSEDPAALLKGYVDLYNRSTPQVGLGRATPEGAVAAWHEIQERGMTKRSGFQLTSVHVLVIAVLWISCALFFASRN